MGSIFKSSLCGNNTSHMYEKKSFWSLLQVAVTKIKIWPLEFNLFEFNIGTFMWNIENLYTKYFGSEVMWENVNSIFFSKWIFISYENYLYIKKICIQITLKINDRSTNWACCLNPHFTSITHRIKNQIRRRNEFFFYICREAPFFLYSFFVFQILFAIAGFVLY